MATSIQRINVLGAGVVGLSTAIVLAERGFRGQVKVIADKRTPATVASDTAAAFWYPFHVGPYKHKWAEQTYEHFQGLLTEPSAGIWETPCREYFCPTPEKDKEAWLNDLWWRRIKRVAFTELDATQVPEGFTAGSTFKTPIVHMPTYLRYLEDRFLAPKCSGVFETRHVKRLQDILSDCEVAVNCTGMGSETLADVLDNRLVPCQGQVVRIRPIPVVRELLFITTGKAYVNKPLYIVPRGPYDIVLGGTTVDGARGTVADPSVTSDILARCSAFCPVLKAANIIESLVGIRPTHKDGVRLELDLTGRFPKPVVHNYGHGGGGVTLSWGCAEQVHEFVKLCEPGSVQPHSLNN